MRSRVAGVTAMVVFVAAITAIAFVAEGGNDELPRLPIGSAGREVTADIALAAPFEIEYRLGDVARLPRTATAYRAEPVTDIENRMRALAKALDLRGDPEPKAGGWVIEDGERVLRVERAAGAPWRYSSTGSDRAVSQTATACAAPAEPQEPGADGCEPERPHRMPSEDDAIAAATKVFAAAGTSLDGAAVKADDLGSEWIVSADPVVAGRPTIGMTVSAGIGPEGAVQYAGGHLVRPERVGDYPLIRAGAIIPRLEEPPFGVPAPHSRREPGTIVDVPPVTIPPIEIDPPNVSIPPIEPEEVEPFEGFEDLEDFEGFDGEEIPFPPETISPPDLDLPEPDVRVAPPDLPHVHTPALPQKIVRTLTAARLGLTFVPAAFDPDGPAHLIPTFLLKYRDEPVVGDPDENAELSVLAVTDEHLDRSGIGFRGDDDGHSVSFGSGSVSSSGRSSSCVGSTSDADDGGDSEPMTIQVCAEPTTVYAGEEVTFRVTVSDPDARIDEDDCREEPRAVFGDEGTPSPQCVADCETPDPSKKYSAEPGKLADQHTHRYERPGTYTAIFTYHSGSVCEPNNPYASRGQVEVEITVVDR